MRVGAGAGDHAKAASGFERRRAEPGVTAALLKEVVPAQVHRMLFPGICAFTHDSPGDARVKNTNGDATRCHRTSSTLLFFAELGSGIRRRAEGSPRLPRPHAISPELTLGWGRVVASIALDVAAVGPLVAHWHILRISPEIVERARRPFAGEPIRTLDAIHLASALAARSMIAGLALVSLDDRIRKSAEPLGLSLRPE